MKKMSIIAAVLACVTVGGVYATWNYAGTENVPLKMDETTLTLTDAHKSGEYGSYSITKSDDFTMVIDSEASAENVTGSHKAVLVINGSVTISFKPNDTSSEEVKSQGIETKFFFSPGGGIDTWVCDAPDTVAEDSMPIFKTFDQTEHIIKAGTTDNGGDWTWDATAGAFTYTLSAEDIETYFELSELTLDTYEKYETFRDDIVGKNIVLTVNDTTGAVEAPSTSDSESDSSDSNA